MRRLPPAQRDVVLTRILEDDADIAVVRPVLRATIDSARRIWLSLRRDAVD